MKVKLAKTAGFCMGVRKAMELVLAEANKKKEGPIYTYGPLIHNSQVMDLLELKGVKPIKDIRQAKTGTVLIRAHGIPPDKRQELRSSDLRIIDATCPRVAKVQALIRYHTKKGYHAVIVGDKDHAEVIGLVGYGNGKAFVISSPEEVGDLPPLDQVMVVAQTTQEEKIFEHIVSSIEKKYSHPKVFNTICHATHDRQEEVRTLAENVEGMVVVGGYHSGNTQRLAQISEAEGVKTFHIETEDELESEKLKNMSIIGVTAGASTPNWMIKNVISKIEGIKGSREKPFVLSVKNLVKMLLVSNVIIALGSFSLCYAVSVLAGNSPDLVPPVLVSLYVYAMHVLNRFLDKGASTYNDPYIALFYRKHIRLLLTTSIISVLSALWFSFILNRTFFFALAGFTILGIGYSLSIFPVRQNNRWRFLKIKDIPGSKTFSEALAWAVIISLLTLLEPEGQGWGPAIISFLFVLSIVYVRSALFDIFQFQGDLIVGTETLPIILGVNKTLKILKWIIYAGAGIILFTSLIGIVTPFSYLLLFCYLLLFLSLLSYEKIWIYPGTRLELLVEGSLFLAGILALFWQLSS